PCMMKRQAPPGFTLISWVVVVKPLGPHHFPTCFGSVKALNTSSRGASMSRVMTISRSAVSPAAALPARWAFSLVTLLLLHLQVLHKIFQPIEAAFPEDAVALDPIGDLPQGLRLEPARPPLRMAAARDQPGALQHLEMLGDRGRADGERCRQLLHRGLARYEPRQDGPACGIREGREGGAEVIRRHI